MTCSFCFRTILAFLKMAFCKLQDEHWALNLKSLGLDTLSDTETRKPFQSIALLSINSIFYCHKSPSGSPISTGAMGREPVTLID